MKEDIEYGRKTEIPELTIVTKHKTPEMLPINKKLIQKTPIPQLWDNTV